MPSEKQKQYRNKWDAQNMKNVVCKMRRDIAEEFMELCRSNGTTANKVLHDCILQYLSENRGSSDSAPHSF